LKYSIDYNNVQRDITGPFNIIGSPADLLYIADCIRDQVGDPDHPRFSYGTVFIAQRYLPSDSANGRRHAHWTDGPFPLHNSPEINPDDGTSLSSRPLLSPAEQRSVQLMPQRKVVVEEPNWENLLRLLEAAREVLAHRYKVTNRELDAKDVEAVQPGWLDLLANAVQVCRGLHFPVSL
jgi:hypothetical protein